MPVVSSDPFTSTHLWFAVLCEEVGLDQRGRLDLRRVFNVVNITTPPEGSGIPVHAHLQGALAMGFTEGVGEFTASVELRDLDNHTLWQAETPWRFRMGPGETAASVHAERVDYWFTEAGHYKFVITLEPALAGRSEYPVYFEVVPPGRSRVRRQNDPSTPQE